MAHAFDCLVVKIQRSTETSGGKLLRVNGKAVVLRGDFHPAGFQILYRLIAAAMAELQLEGLSAKRLAENLMPKANPENWDAGVNKGLHLANDVIERRRDRPGRWTEKFPPACI